jgi:hypothetical protein
VHVQSIACCFEFPLPPSPFGGRFLTVYAYHQLLFALGFGLYLVPGLGQAVAAWTAALVLY